MSGHEGAWVSLTVSLHRLSADRELIVKPPILLDGGMGQELIRRGANRKSDMWAAWALVHDPELVTAVHTDYIAAGVDVLTTNTYHTSADRLEYVGFGDRTEELTRLAGRLAREVADNAGRDVMVAASLPPLRHSYNPDPDATYEELLDEYSEMVGYLAESVDLFLPETMGALFEAQAAVDAARESGRTVWVSFTLQGSPGPHLLDGTSFAEAVASIDADAYLINCCPPEEISSALPILRAVTNRPVGVYANGFREMPLGYRRREGDPLPPARTDMGTDRYAQIVLEWVDAGADIVGGCCEIGPDHIARIRQVLPQPYSDL